MVAYAPPPRFSLGFAKFGTLHIIEQGELWLEIDKEDEPAERVRCGDVILLPRGDAHHLTSAQREPRPRSGDAADTAPSAAEAARWLCGTFTIDHSQSSYLLASLPAVLMLRGAREQALEWLEVSRRMLLYEIQSPTQGSVVMVARILDLLFIQMLRAWASQDDAEPGWLPGALDPHIGPALSAIHNAPARDWTVRDLAFACNLSRSAFAERFTTRVGTPPATYLGHVRLDAAATMLRETSIPLALVAERVGYTSAPAFTRAFKHHFGAPPARWRRDARDGLTTRVAQHAFE
jgi:AraC-like DNA-binding protein